VVLAEVEALVAAEWTLSQVTAAGRSAVERCRTAAADALLTCSLAAPTINVPYIVQS